MGGELGGRGTSKAGGAESNRCEFFFYEARIKGDRRRRPGVQPSLEETDGRGSAALEQEERLIDASVQVLRLLDD